MLQRIEELLPFSWQPSDDMEVEYLYSVVVGNEPERRGFRKKHVVYSDAQLLQGGEGLDFVLKALERDLHLFIGEMARGRVFVHAGAVGWKNRAILLPGLTFTGKSTLVAELVRGGATYYSDEFAVLDSEGFLHPFARPLSLRDRTSHEGRSIEVEELGGVRGQEAIPVGMVIATEFDSEAGWNPNKVSQGEAVLALFANTLSARRQPEVVLPVLHKSVAGATLFSGPRGEAREAARRILNLLSAR